MEQTYLHCASYRSINSHHLVFRLFHRPSLFFFVLLHSFLATSQHAVRCTASKKVFKDWVLESKDS